VIIHLRDKPHTVQLDPPYERYLAQWQWRIYKYQERLLVQRADGACYMHNMIMAPPPGAVVIHLNDNGLDNRIENLRVVDRAVRAQRAQRTRATANYRGVFRTYGALKWRAQIIRDGKAHYLGYFDREEDAARAYDAAAYDLFGPYARLNFARP